MRYSDLVGSDYMAKNDYNCAETMLRAADEAYGLGLDERALHAAAAFGGGMGRERACGALTGGLMAIGCLLARDRSHRDPGLVAARDAFVKAFEEHFGSLDCAAIKQSHRSAERGCAPVVEETAVLLERVVQEARSADTVR